MSDIQSIFHGAQFYISPAKPSDLGAVADYNAAAFKSGGNRYQKAAGLLTIGGSAGITREIATASPMDSATVIKRLVDSRNFGEVTFEFLRDDDDLGQAAIVTGSTANAQVTIKLALQHKSGGDLHETDDNAIYFYGFIKMDTNPGGGPTDFQRRSVSVELTTMPLYHDGIN